MTATGATWQTKYQAAIEGTKGTILPATRLLTDVTNIVAPEYAYQKMTPGSIRGSLHPRFRTPITEKFNVKMSGLQIDPTFESLPWWLQFFVKGGVTGSLTATTGYTYTFTPTGSADDLKTLNLEMAVGDTTAEVYSYGVGEKFALGWGGGKAPTLSVDFSFQKWTAQALTGALNPVAWESVPANFVAKIDPTTIGTTAAPRVLDGSLEITNGWEWVWTGDGNLYPNRVNRTGYDAKLSGTAIFEALTDRDAFIANTEQKIRTIFTGSTIASSSPTTPKSLTIDFFGYHTAAPVQIAGSLWAVKFDADVTYDVGTSKTFEISVVNALTTLP